MALMPIGAYDAPSGRDVHMNPEELSAPSPIPGPRCSSPALCHLSARNGPYDEPLERLLSEADRLGISEQILIAEEGVGIEW